tara:strand:+ start:2320 stop:3246 length:927 start_codon:yes stop_codon:yes gene_type:complete
MNFKKAISYVKKLPKNSISIFLFHGIIDSHFKSKTITNYNNKHIQAKDFRYFLRDISKISDPISMDEVYEITKEKKKLNSKKFAVTFDDGFENNLSIATPILKKFKIPYTIYITTKFIENNFMSWIDTIDYAIDKTKRKNLKIPGFKKKFLINSRSKKILILNKIRSYVKSNKKVDPYKFSKQICDHLSINKFPRNNVIYKKLSWKQIKMLFKNNLCIIGGHSHSHKILGYLSNSELKYEVEKSCKLIRKNLGFKIEHYSYPEGFKKSFSKKVISLLKKNNIKCCPTALNGYNNEKSNPFLLKRLVID